MELWQERMVCKNERSGREDAKRKKIKRRVGCRAKDEMDAEGYSRASPLWEERRNLWRREGRGRK